MNLREETKGRREDREEEKKKHEEARFTQGDLCWFSLFGRASGVRLAGSCCTATVTRVTSLRRLSSAASRCLGIRTFRTGAKDDKVHTFHPRLLTLVCDGGEVTGRDRHTFTGMWKLFSSCFNDQLQTGSCKTKP